MQHSRIITFVGALAGAGAIALGAIGAHGSVQEIPAPRQLQFNLATNYLLLHAPALIAIGGWIAHKPTHYAYRVAGYLMILGIVLFCGGLLGRAMFEIAWLAKATPFGGSALIGAWLAIATGALFSGNSAAN